MILNHLTVSHRLKSLTLDALKLPMKYIQIKSNWYYIFWSIATAAVVVGQISVVISHNRLSDNLESIIIEQAREKINKASN